MLHAKQGNWFSGKMYLQAAVCRENLPTVPKKILRFANYSWWKEILQVVQPNRDVTGIFRPSCRFAGKILNVEKAMAHRVFDSEEIQEYLYGAGYHHWNR